MKRTMKAGVVIGLSALMILGTAAIAMAVPTLSLSANPTQVTYPQHSFLRVSASDGAASLATTVTVQYRPIGTTDWKRVRTISASRTAEGPVRVPVSPYFLRGTADFRAIATGLESDAVTISVKARLSKAIARSKVKAGKRVTVRGHIWPRHAAGSRPVVVKFWRWDGDEWVYKGHVHPKIVKRSGDGSMWRFTRRTSTDDKGKWRMRVYHEDTQHAESMSRYSYIRVR